MAKKEYHKAIKVFERAIQIRPDYVNAHLSLGNTYRLINRCDKAVQAYANVVKYKPYYASVYNNMGVCLNQLKQYDKAFQAYELAIKYNPNNFEYLNNLATLYSSHQKYDKALPHYYRAYQIAQQRRNTVAQELLLYYLSICLYKLEKIEDADKAFNTAQQKTYLKKQQYENLQAIMKQVGLEKQAEEIQKKIK